MEEEVGQRVRPCFVPRHCTFTPGGLPDNVKLAPPPARLLPRRSSPRGRARGQPTRDRRRSCWRGPLRSSHFTSRLSLPLRLCCCNVAVTETPATAVRRQGRNGCSKMQSRAPVVEVRSGQPHRVGIFIFLTSLARRSDGTIFLTCLTFVRPGLCLRNPPL